MPKTVPPGLLDPGRVRCLAVKVLRRDGVAIGLTDTNLPFVYQGLAYSPVGGVSSSTIQSDVGTSAGSLSFKTLEGVADAVGASITAEDLRGGRYAGAQGWVYELDPLHPELGAIVHNRYVFARATLKDAEKQIELREALYRLKLATGRTLTSECDVVRPWDKRCDPHRTLLAAPSFVRTLVAVPSDLVLHFGGDSHPDGYFTQGYLEWTGGPNAGLTDDVKLHELLAGNVARITLKTPPGFVPGSGDVATLVRGCDRSRAACKAVANPHNLSGTNVENNQSVRLPLPDDVARVGRQAKK